MLRWLLAGAMLCLALPIPASAHADLVWSDPAAGGVYPAGTLSHLTLQFDEIIEPVFSSVEVHSSRLVRVDVGGIQVDPTDPRILRVDLVELEPDVYTVTWLVVSTVDGHSTSGLFSFSIGLEAEEPSLQTGAPPTSAATALSGWEVGVRWLMFIAALAVFGALLLVPVVLIPARAAVGVESGAMWPGIQRKLNTLIIGAALLWFGVGLVSLRLQLAVIGQGSLSEALANGMLLRLLGTRFGLILALRQLLALMLLALFWRNRSRGSQPSERQRLVEIALAAALLASLSLSSHAAAGPLWPALAAIVDWLHLLANGAWVGGLFALVVAVVPALRRLPVDERGSVLRLILRRFSALAAVGVLVAVTTGAFSAALHFLLPIDLTETSYGKALGLKLALALLILLIGLANTLALRPEFVRRVPLNWRWLQRWRAALSPALRVEALVGLLILLATALLTALPTPAPRPLPSGQIPFNSELRQVDLPQDRLKAFVALAPNWIGWNRYLIVLHDESGTPISNAERVRLRFYLPEVEARTDWVITTPAQDGLYVASGQQLVLAGGWRIEVDIRRSGMADTRFTVAWPLAAPPAVVVDPAQPRGINWLALAGLGLCSIGLVLWGSLRRGVRITPLPGVKTISSHRQLAERNGQPNANLGQGQARDASSEIPDLRRKNSG